jgi:hypothetical protein
MTEDEAIEAIFASEQFTVAATDFIRREGDIAVFDNGYGPGDERSEIRIDIRKILRAINPKASVAA